MFNKKELEELNAKLKDVSEDLKKVRAAQEQMAGSNKECYEGLHARFEDLKQNHVNFSSGFAKELDEIAKVKEEFSRSLRSFQQMHAKVYDQVYDKLNDLLRGHSNELKSTTDKYKAMSPEVGRVLADISSLRAEILKFRAISENIKHTDFELEKHQKNLERHEHEKLRMMQQIEGLHRLIGKQRRRLSME